MMNNELKKRIKEYFANKKDEMLELLGELVSYQSIATPTDSLEAPYGKECRRVLDYLLTRGEKEGFVTRNYDNHLGAISLKTPDLSGSIALISHLDVVPATGDWDYQPFAMQKVGDYVVGRGVSDNKAAAVAVFYILKCLKELGIKPKHNLTLLLGTAEEIGMYDVDYFTSHYEAPLFTLVPDASYPCGRGEFGRVNFDLKGALSSDFIEMYSNEAYNLVPDYAFARLKIELKEFDSPKVKVKWDGSTSVVEAYGKAIHAANAPLGENAINNLLEYLVALESLSNRDRQTLKSLLQANKDAYGSALAINYEDSVSGQTVCSGNYLRLEKGQLRLGFDVRYAVTQVFEQMEKRIKQFASLNELDYHLIKAEKPYYLAMDNKAVATVLAVYNQVAGTNIDFIPIMKGGTYASHLPNALSIGMSYLSAEEKANQDLSFLKPGHGGAHQKDEILSIKGFMQGIELLLEIVLELDERL